LKGTKTAENGGVGVRGMKDQKDIFGLEYARQRTEGVNLSVFAEKEAEAGTLESSLVKRAVRSKL